MRGSLTSTAAEASPLHPGSSLEYNQTGKRHDPAGEATMDYQTVMAELKKSGTAQARKIYARHGVRGDQYGVSYAVLGRLKKQIKIRPRAGRGAVGLGQSRRPGLGHDGRRPAQVDLRLATAWSKDLDNYGLSDAVAGLFAKSPKVRDKFARWTKSKNEWLGVLGYGILNRRALDVDTPEDEIRERRGPGRIHRRDREIDPRPAEPHAARDEHGAGGHRRAQSALQKLRWRPPSGSARSRSTTARPVARRPTPQPTSRRPWRTASRPGG